ncbi:conjugative transposon protein TraM [Rufibacter ruber]|uniref:conjugative transposon protein TraM n=1 Tax=Rufibacter ruber TaxID=1783499 RepID=UPI00082E8F45|nr:conjugative transposon protein TraM [Rufibacter ruber]
MDNLNEYGPENDFRDSPTTSYSPPEKAKRTPVEILKEHWFKLLLGLVMVIFAGLFLWLKSAQNAAEQNTVPVAAASENIEQAIPEVVTDNLENKTPSAILEEQRKAEQEAQYAQAAPSEEEVANAFVVDTAGQAARRRYNLQLQQQAKLAFQEVDTVETTVQDQSTGQYRTQQIIVPRNTNRRSGSRPTANNMVAPAYDADGTPFETNPEVLRMLAASSPQTRRIYEQTTGKRYREPGAANAPRESQAALPGADGFNTYKVTNSRFNPGDSNTRQGTLTPDVFYKCVISGEQKIRTGSVVIMRLLEDAVVSGVTFPKNMVFAGIAKVESNRVTVQIERLGPTRVKADIFNFNYMPGIMIDPEKKIAKDTNQGIYDAQRQASQELSTAIDRSASAANSVVGVAGRVAANVVSKPRSRQRLRDVLLPDGYPILITSAAAGQMAPAGSAGAN